MKTRLFSISSFGLALSLLPLVAGCYGQASDSPQGNASATNAESVVTPVPDANLVVAGQETAQIAMSVPDQPDTPIPAAPAADKPLPPNIRPSSPVAEVIKLTQSGVDEGVMLTFVSNSASAFNLGSDEIIYLNDLGVLDNVVTAMIQRDQTLKGFWPNAAQASATPAAQAQVAEVYENPPPAEVQPTESYQESSPPVDASYFYDSLSPYGNWVSVDGYGQCWQPTVVVINHNWQPYCDRGRWVYSDCGWYWLSDYSWGWAPFHYGRWFRHQRFGWCWTPDTVWAPAWVSWRYSNDYCGWAPLPPAAYYRPGFGFAFHGGAAGFGFGLSADHYSFVPWNHFWDHRPNRFALSHNQATQVFNNTTVINNFAQGNNNTVINRGIPHDRVGSFTRTEVRQVALHEMTATNNRGGRGEHLDRDGRTITLQRPHFAAAPSAEGRGGYGGRQGFSRGAANSTPPDAQVSPGSMPPATRVGGQSQPMPTPRDTSPRNPSRGDRTDNTTPGRNPGNSSTASPPINRGSDRANPPAATAAPPPPAASPGETVPPSSGIVIGRRDTTQPRGQNFQSAPASRDPFAGARGRNSLAESGTAAPAARNNFPQQPIRPNPPQAFESPPVQTPAPQFNRQDNPRITRGIEDRVDAPPVASAPAQRQVAPPVMPRPAPAPAYTPAAPNSAPMARQVERPQYSPPPAMPRPTPAPSYTPPPQPRAPSAPAPAPSYSAPAPSHTPSAPAPAPAPAPSRSDSGRQSSDSGRQSASQDSRTK